jgi:hypothetical protein
LAENGLVEESGRKRMLAQLFSHLESEVQRVVDVKNALLEQMEAKVRELLTNGESLLLRLLWTARRSRRAKWLGLQDRPLTISPNLNSWWFVTS